MISKALLKELDQILQKEYNLNLTEAKLSNFGEFLLGYFQTLSDIEKDSEKRKRSKTNNSIDLEMLRG